MGLVRVPVPGQTTDKRSHKRVAISVPGRYMLETGQEHPCVAVDLSPGGLRLNAETIGYMGSRVVVYLEKFGRLEGRIARPTPGGFALRLDASPARREKLAAELAQASQAAPNVLGDKRKQARITPDERQTVVTLHDGSALQAEIVDLSPSGVLFSCRLRLEAGMTIRVGATPARVVRVTSGGAAARFVTPLPVHEFGPAVTL